MEPLTLGLITGGLQAVGAIGGFFGQQNAARAENEARIKQYKQQILIQRVRDLQRFNVYNKKVGAYNDTLKGLDKRFARMQMQDDLRMNELLKGSKLASRDDLVKQVQAGGVFASQASGGSTAKTHQSKLMQIGEATTLRNQQLMTSEYAKQFKDIANRETLEAARENAWSKVRYAPQQSIPLKFGSMVQGPSPYSLIAGIGNAALSGVSAGMGQANFEESIASGMPQQIANTQTNIPFDGSWEKF